MTEMSDDNDVVPKCNPIWTNDLTRHAHAHTRKQRQTQIEFGTGRALWCGWALLEFDGIFELSIWNSKCNRIRTYTQLTKYLTLAVAGLLTRVRAIGQLLSFTRSGHVRIRVQILRHLFANDVDQRLENHLHVDVFFGRRLEKVQFKLIRQLTTSLGRHDTFVFHVTLVAHQNHLGIVPRILLNLSHPFFDEIARVVMWFVIG